MAYLEEVSISKGRRQAEYEVPLGVFRYSLVSFLLKKTFLFVADDGRVDKLDRFVNDE
jgi:hypothetical protein